MIQMNAIMNRWSGITCNGRKYRCGIAYVPYKPVDYFPIR